MIEIKLTNDIPHYTTSEDIPDRLASKSKWMRERKRRVINEYCVAGTAMYGVSNSYYYLYDISNTVPMQSKVNSHYKRNGR